MLRLLLCGVALVIIASSAGSSLAADTHVIAATPSITWRSETGESTTGGDPLVVEVAKGDTIEVHINGGTHGVVTLDGPGNASPPANPATNLVQACGQDENPEAVLREVECDGTNSQFNKRFIGTLKLEVTDKFSADTNFWCVEHEGAMWGVIQLKK